jgi:hypothetical protein
MMKRFSVTVFIVIAVLHFIGTDRLIRAGFWAEKAAQPEHNVLWITIWSWIWWPVPRLLWQVVPSTHSFQGGELLVWSLCVGALFGFLAPRLFAWRRRSSNQSVELTATRRTLKLSDD